MCVWGGRLDPLLRSYHLVYHGVLNMILSLPADYLVAFLFRGACGLC